MHLKLKSPLWMSSQSFVPFPLTKCRWILGLFWIKVILSSSKAQVLMVRGICKNWKQPIYFQFDQPMTKKILIDVIERLEKIGLKVLCHYRLRS